MGLPTESGSRSDGTQTVEPRQIRDRLVLAVLSNLVNGKKADDADVHLVPRGVISAGT